MEQCTATCGSLADVKSHASDGGLATGVAEAEANGYATLGRPLVASKLESLSSAGGKFVLNVPSMLTVLLSMYQFAPLGFPASENSPTSSSGCLAASEAIRLKQTHRDPMSSPAAYTRFALFLGDFAATSGQAV